LLLDSGLYQKVDALRRNQWSASAGIGGRLAPELVVGFPRIMQPVKAFWRAEVDPKN
jgi:hypothetical protein